MVDDDEKVAAAKARRDKAATHRAAKSAAKLVAQRPKRWATVAGAPPGSRTRLAPVYRELHDLYPLRALRASTFLSPWYLLIATVLSPHTTDVPVT